MREVPCGVCQGARLKPEVLAVTLGDRSIAEVAAMSIGDCAAFLRDARARPTGRRSSPSASSRRSTPGWASCSTSGWTTSRSTAPPARSPAARRSASAWRRRSAPGSSACSTSSTSRRSACTSATTAGSSTPCCGCKALGNTLIVVEHDEDTIQTADWVVDIGPGAGEHGGQVVVSGSVEELLASEDSITGQYLSGRREIAVPDGAPPAHQGPRADRRRRPRAQPARRHGVVPARPARRGHRRQRLGQVDAGQRHPGRGAGQAAQRHRARSPAGTPASPGSSTSTRSSASTSRRSAAPRGRTRRPTPASSTTCASCSPRRPRRRSAATCRGASPSTSRAAAARRAPATARSRSR